MSTLKERTGKTVEMWKRRKRKGSGLGFVSVGRTSSNSAHRRGASLLKGDMSLH